MVKQDRTNRAVCGQVVLIRRVVAVPCNDVQRRLADFRFVELTAPFNRDGRRHFAVFIGSNRGFEVTRVGHAVGTNRATARKLEFLAVVFTDEATCGAFQKLNTIDQSTRNDADFLRRKVDDAQFRIEAQLAFLRHDQQLAVGREEIVVDHRLGHKIDVAGHTDLRVHITRRGHGAHAGDPVQTLGRRHRIPTILTQRDHVRIHARGRFPVRHVDLGVARRVLHRRADTIGPCALGRVGGEGGAGQLLAIQAIFAFLRAVHALRQRAGQSLGFEIIRPTGHIMRFGANG